MILELSQNRLFIKRKIIIADTKVLYRSSKFGNNFEINIPYEELTSHKETYRINFEYGWLIIGILTLSSIASFSWRNDKEYDPHMWIFFTLLTIAAFAFHFQIRENVWRIKLQNYTYIFINKKLPNEDEVNNFIDNLFKQRNKYLEETYLHINRNMAYEPQFKNLQWLKKTEAIDREVFEKKKKELDVLFNSDRKIGF